MRRYTIRADSESDERWFDRELKPMSLTVLEPDDAPQDTGLFDAHGNKLYATNKLEPIGFIHPKQPKVGYAVTN